MNTSDSTKLSVGRVLQFLIPVMGVSIGIISLLVSSAARKKELTCTLLNTTRLVSENLGGISPDMRVEFRGQPIRTLSKMTFSLRNTGAAAVRQQDVSDPVHLQFPQTANLLSATVERTLPLRFPFSAKEATQSSQVVLDFPLLNSGDEAIFSVYVLNSEPQRPTFEGRIVDVPQLVYTESTPTNGAPSDWPHWSHATKTVIRWVLLVLYALLTVGAVGLRLYESIAKIRHARWHPKWSKPFHELEKEVLSRESEERGKRRTQLRAEADKMNPADRDAYLKASSPEFDYASYKRKLNEECKNRSIPREPRTETSGFGDFLSFSLVFLGIACIFAITAVVVRTALPG